MREILFKAKRKDNGEWVEGSLVHRKASVGKSELCLIVCSAEWLDNPKWFILCNTHYVDPETVCQYTGLKDKNGKKIFEGDILKYSWYIGDHLISENIIEIHYKDGSFCYRENDEDYFIPIDDSEYGISLNTYEVIGNIFDNPELLEV